MGKDRRNFPRIPPGFAIVSWSDASAREGLLESGISDGGGGGLGNRFEDFADVGAGADEA